jgi:hypothetical protein
MTNNELNILAIESMKTEAYKRADAAGDDPHECRNYYLGEIAAFNKILRLLRKQS